MKIITTKDAAAGGVQAFKVFEAGINNGAKVLGLATGSTPLSLYQELVNSDLDTSNLTSVNLDEYVGLTPDNDQSYHYFMQKHLFDQKPFKKTYVPDGIKAASDPEGASADYDQIIKENPIDIQLLGIGQNGHIAFNEPGTAFDSVTHEVKLTDNTIQANSRFFNDITEVPTSAICMGIANIMSAKKIVLMAFGANKADAVKQMIEGPVTEEVPASILQKHNDVTVIVDEAAASKLNN
ncbi:glucosamine-6-phosphate deaminase [Lactobacillus sp. ESL0684]|uniref:glucosamine-6-phosphate deaminase n=1 Tax=unclassified Lactobacillus TaxID=2620435 RepID=UPI0023F716B6|nr:MULTISPECIES: glucosamine-6-phosphate deaminase [unclassified Lactobacillus]WEV39835.1 glucosamine-6-phosphate deaminase [Lactobacillus sp. ESL0681]WEV43640.1 glucosamine-6-phosphate deaminase [Lactobacillus sp. ESL0684]